MPPLVLAPKRQLDKITTRLHQVFGRSAREIIEAGRLLQAAKNLFADCPALGIFSDWLDREFQMSAETARRFMRVTLRFSELSKTGHSDRFATKALYLLASSQVDADALDEAFEHAAAGEHITARKAEEIIAEHRSIERALVGLTEEEKLEFIQTAEAEELARQEQAQRPTRKQRSLLEKMLHYVKELRGLHKRLPIRRQADSVLKQYERVLREVLAKGRAE